MIRVEKAGPLTTVQDAGRPGYRAAGVPLGGAMDRRALAEANLLCGNAPDAAALEMTVAGGVLRFERDGHAALAGADLEARLDGEPRPAGASFAVHRGAVLSFGVARAGVRGYLAVRGGIDVPPVLGSRSTLLVAGLGGFAGRALRAGDLVPVGVAPGPDPAARSLLPSERTDPGAPVTLRCLLGPQDDAFTDEGLRTLFDSTYRASVHSDRMGCRLDGPAPGLRGAADIVTDAVLPGAVQVTGSGAPIVLGADCQTTGGYAKIATVIWPDLARLSQVRPGEAVRFVRCEHAEAVRAVADERSALSALARRLGVEVAGWR